MHNCFINTSDASVMNVSCAAICVFKLSIQSVRQLQQHKIEVSFEIHRVALSVNICGKSLHIEARQSSARLCWLVLAYIASPIAPHMIIQWIIQSGDLSISEVIFKSESQFNYLFTLKNARLSSNSYIFGTQANIAMKFTEYVV